ncbi:MAG: helix-hairpin-helix domain-containing protein [Paludibacteraceae bacterium]
MKKFRIIFTSFFLLLALFTKVVAQHTVFNIEQAIADIYEQISEESEIELDFTNFYDDLMSLVEKKINLNHFDKEELEKLHFLSETQIDNILYYLYRNAPMNTIYELQLIDGLDMTDIERMLPFVMINDDNGKSDKIQLSDIIKYGKNEFFFRIDKGVETKEGYRLYPEEENKFSELNSKKYLGSPYYNHFKYRFNYRERVKYGITAEKDAGEQFWGSTHKGYDFYSAYFELKDMGKLKILVAGDYRANFGMGLVMHTDFSMGKSAYVTQVRTRTSGLKKFSSTDEYNFFRGAGATIRWGRTDFTAFYSNKMVDADTSKGTITTIKKDGLHRTLTDFEKRNTVNQQLAGGNVTYRQHWFHIGSTAVYTYLNHSLSPAAANYNQFYFRGNGQWAASVDYRFRWQKLNFFGETSISNQYAKSTINGLNFNPVSTVTLVALYRWFSPLYDVFFSNTFSESSKVNNESGFYLGAEIHPIKYWKISAYADSYHFPWLKFGVDAPSAGNDYLIQADYFPRRDISMYWRFKYETNEHNLTNISNIMPVVQSLKKWHIRYRLNYSYGIFSFKNQIDVNSADNVFDKATYGYAASQDISCNFTTVPLGIDLRLQVFDTKEYANRIYIYEQDVLYAFSIPMVYGMGTRYYLNVKYDVFKNISVWLKLAQTVYADDRENIGSGNEKIEGNRKSDFRFLLRWKF